MTRLREVGPSMRHIAATEVGRGSSRLVDAVGDGLENAAERLAVGGGEVWILTGFFLPSAEPPTAETDGPVGAAQLAVAIERLGGTVTLVTDEPCEAVVAAASTAAGARADVWAAPVGDGFDAWLEALLRKPQPDQLVAIERVGPAADGVPRNMRAIDIRPHTAPLERILDRVDVPSIAIGDGGNEIGMGYIPHRLVAQVVTDGELVHCVVGCDDLIVAGTSNWGAQALVAAIQIAREDIDLRDILGLAWHRRVLSELVAAGAADGVTLRREETVDGLAPDEYERVLAELWAFTVKG